VRVVVTWETGKLFGTLKGEKEYTLGAFEASGVGSAIMQAFSTPSQPAGEKVDLTNEQSVRQAAAKAKADMRSLATALESYYIDWNAYPRTLTPYLTTPISYMSAIPNDPFARQPKPIQYELNGKSTWKLWSVGPDQKDDKATLEFDPTNGTISGGDLIRLKQ